MISTTDTPGLLCQSIISHCFSLHSHKKNVSVKKAHNFHWAFSIFLRMVGTRVFHQNKKSEFYLLLLTTLDHWSKYLKNKISKFSDSGFLPPQAVEACRYITKFFLYSGKLQGLGGVGSRSLKISKFCFWDIWPKGQLCRKAVDRTQTFCSHETPYW